MSTYSKTSDDKNGIMKIIVFHWCNIYIGQYGKDVDLMLHTAITFLLHSSVNINTK